MLMRHRQVGVGLIVDPTVKGGKIEEESITCGHCHHVFWIKPPIMRGPVRDDSPNQALCGRCTCCDKLICLNCIGKGCKPMEKALEAYEARENLKRILGG